MAGNQNTLRAGDKIKLDGVLFSNSQTHCGMRRRGEWFIYDGKLVNGRYRVTNLESRIGKYPISVIVWSGVLIGLSSVWMHILWYLVCKSFVWH